MMILRHDQVAEFYAEGKALDVWDNKELWAARRSREGRFYAELLRKYGKKNILDCSAATGFHCFELEKAGYSVTGADKVEALIRRATDNARVMRSNVHFHQVQWSELSSYYGPACFDAVLCLGSSLHHSKGGDLRLAVENMFAILETGGIFVIDQRNYRKIFRTRPRVVFDQCDVEFVLEYPSEREIVFHVSNRRNDSKTSIRVFVTFEEELALLLEDIGFTFVEKYGDFKEGPSTTEADWIQYVVRRP